MSKGSRSVMDVFADDDAVDDEDDNNGRLLMPSLWSLSFSFPSACSSRVLVACGVDDLETLGAA